MPHPEREGTRCYSVMAGRVPAIRARIIEARTDPLFHYEIKR